MKTLPAIGLTGNIGCGKSTVAAVWQELGATIIDADQVGRDVVAFETEYLDWLKDRFGTSIFSGDALNRAVLGRIVFSDKQARDDMNHHIWPFISQRLSDAITSARSGEQIPVVDAALIFEWQDASRYDEIVVVTCDVDQAIARAAIRMNLTVDEMRDRSRSQISQEEKAARAHYVLQNTGTLRELKEKAAHYWHDCVARFS